MSFEAESFANPTKKETHKCVSKYDGMCRERNCFQKRVMCERGKWKEVGITEMWRKTEYDWRIEHMQVRHFLEDGVRMKLVCTNVLC